MGTEGGAGEAEATAGEEDVSAMLISSLIEPAKLATLRMLALSQIITTMGSCVDHATLVPSVSQSAPDSEALRSAELSKESWRAADEGCAWQKNVQLF